MSENKTFSYFYINTDYINCFFLDLPATLDGDISKEIPKYNKKTKSQEEAGWIFLSRPLFAGTAGVTGREPV